MRQTVMIWSKFVPSRDLETVIDFLWISPPPRGVNMEITPSGQFDLTVVLEERHCAYSLFGSTMHRNMIRVLPDATYAGVHFHPAWTYLFFPGFACESLGAVETESSWLGHSADQLFERCREIGWKNALEELVRKRLSSTQALSDTLVDRAVFLINGSHGSIRIEALAEHLGVSKRTLERKFRASIGLCPKAFSKVARLRALADNIRQNPDLTWAERAMELSYADQSHMIREIKSLTGQPLSALQERFALRPNDWF